MYFPDCNSFCKSRGKIENTLISKASRSNCYQLYYVSIVCESLHKLNRTKHGLKTCFHNLKKENILCLFQVDLSLSTDELQRYFGVSSHEKGM